MEKEKPQSFAHHGRIFAPFHMFVLPVLMINIVYSLVRLKNGITFDSVWMVVMALGFFVMAGSLRVMSLSVQDRVIRTEMQLRMERMLPADLRPRIGEFNVEQLVALRFAGDDELPALARQVLEEKLTNRKAIKQRVKNWRPDYQRA
jgi:hypothetical protein